MYFLTGMVPLKLYKRQFVVPIDMHNKRKGSAIYLMSPNIDSAINMTKYPLANIKYFEAFYSERNALIYINNDSTAALEENAVPDMPTSYFAPICSQGDAYIENDIMRINLDESHNFLIPLNEAGQYNSQLRKIIWSDRIKTIKELDEIYAKVTGANPAIKKTFYKIEKYLGFNLFVDLSFYMNLFIENNIYTIKKAMAIFSELVTRLIKDPRYSKFGYNRRTIFVDLSGWYKACKCSSVDELLDYRRSINPLSMIHYLLFMKHEIILRNLYKDFEFVIAGPKSYMRLNMNELDKSSIPRYKEQIKRLMRGDFEDNDPDVDSRSVTVMKTIEKIEKKTGIHINDLSAGTNIDNGEIKLTSYALVGEPIKVKNKNDNPSQVLPVANGSSIPKAATAEKKREIKNEKLKNDKDELVQFVSAKVNELPAEELDDAIENDNYLKNIIANIASAEDDGIKITKARRERIDMQDKAFLKAKVKNVTVKEAIEKSKTAEPLEETALKVDSINEEWQHMTFNSFEKKYDLNADIMAILRFLSTRSAPISIRNVEVEDTTTSEDYIETYKVDCEDVNGKRFRLVFDVPKIKNNRFMRLRGNDKTMNGQLVLIPCIKTDEDTVQMVSNYNKIFIRRYGMATGKSNPAADKLLKALAKYDGDKIKVQWGDTSRICSKYELPLPYIDISSGIIKIETPKRIYYFNQDEIRSKYDITEEEMLKNHEEQFPYAYDKERKQILYLSTDANDFAETLVLALTTEGISGFDLHFVEQQSTSSKYVYSRASILNTEIPVIVILGYSYGLTDILKSAGIDIDFREKAPGRADSLIKGFIRFKDGYLCFLNYGSYGMLLNGLKDCPTEDYSFAEVDSKAMWMDFLDGFGGRIKADGIDNFVDLFVDPKTETICELYNLPTTYKNLMLYSNALLCDNAYNKHTDITGNRYRNNEIIGGYVYKCLATSYGTYATALKRNKNGTAMTIKRSAIIDAILLDPTCSDLSKSTPLAEKESANAIGFKGLSGMNSDRSYSLDKRTYHDTMINKVALSTGFAENSGITRQATIDMDISTNMGMIKNEASPNDMSITKTFSMTEAMTPFAATRDDPFRTAMTHVQTSKHLMRTNISHPLLVTYGADEALPYLTSDEFSWKAKGKGVIAEKTNDYMVIQYEDPNIPSEFVDLREKVEKNSDGGFFITIQLETDMKQGDKVKAGDIVAYDHKSYSNIVGATNNIAAVPGTLTKIAILNTDEGFEDSTVITNLLSAELGSEVCTKKERSLDKNTNVYFLVKPGTPVQEGDNLLIFQNAYDDKDANILLKTLSQDDGDDEAISDLGRVSIKSKYTGVVQDVKIMRTCELDEMSESLKKIVTAYEANIKKYRKVMTKYKTEDIEAFDADYKLEPTGNLKDCPDGVKIIIYIKYFDKMSAGDKLVQQAALKGVARNVIPVGKEPYSELHPDEEISSLLANSGVNKRMVASIELVGAINKGLIELDRQVKEIMGIPYKTIQEWDREEMRKNGIDV